MTNTLTIDQIRAMREDDIALSESWDSLRRYGLNYLTGEACAFGMRGLVDLNDEGVSLMSAFFGGTVTFRLGSNWNSKVDGKPAVASVLLTHDMLFDILRFALFYRNNVRWVVRLGTMVYGLSNEEHLRIYRDMNDSMVYHNWAWKPGTRSTGRNVHAFSGREE